MSAEYIMSSGNPNVILCERGIRTFETYMRNTLDLGAVPLLHHLTHLPVIVDPSHATGKRFLVKPLVLAGVAAGADGAILEVHPRPEEALSDGEQSLTLDQFREIMAPRRPGPRRGGVAPQRVGARRLRAARRRRQALSGTAMADASGATATPPSCATPRACAASRACPATSRSAIAPSSSRSLPRGRSEILGRRRRRRRALHGAVVARLGADGRAHGRAATGGSTTASSPRAATGSWSRTASSTAATPARRSGSPPGSWRRGRSSRSSTATRRCGRGRCARVVAPACRDGRHARGAAGRDAAPRSRSRARPRSARSTTPPRSRAPR